MRPQHLPNLISALRVVLIVPVVLFLLQGKFGLALVVFAAAGFSDALDGYLARRFGWFSPLGGWLDPLADKAMMVSSYLALAYLGLIPGWLVAAVVARDLIIVLGSLAYSRWVERFEAAPSLMSKLNTLMQILLVMAVMWNAGVTSLPTSLVDALVAAVAATIVLSGAGYMWTWGMRALRLRRRSRSRA